MAELARREEMNLHSQGMLEMAAESSSISILIASANEMPTQLMASALNRQSRFRVTTILDNARDIIDEVKRKPVDVALIRATLADDPMSGFAALRHLHECVPGLKAIMLLDSPEPNLVVNAFRAGAKGIFYPSQSNFKALCRCVDRVHAGQIWAMSSDLSHVLDTFARVAPMHVVDASGMRLLTKREEDVVRLLLTDGLQNREIANELNLSEHTIKNYLFRIFEKLGISSRIELILYAMSNSKRLQVSDLESEQKELEQGAEGEHTRFVTSVVSQ
jgi:DNA-binding NarL/FixJ family response regulator